MKKLFVLTLVLVWAGGTQAALTLVNAPTEPIDIGETIVITVNNSEDGAYGGWLEIPNPEVLTFGDVELTPEGGAGDALAQVGPPAEDNGSMWVEFTVASAAKIAAGDHVLVNVVGNSQGATKLNLYAEDGTRLLDSADITVIPEPATIALLGLGALLLCRRK